MIPALRALFGILSYPAILPEHHPFVRTTPCKHATFLHTPYSSNNTFWILCLSSIILQALSIRCSYSVTEYNDIASHHDEKVGCKKGGSLLGVFFLSLSISILNHIILAISPLPGPSVNTSLSCNSAFVIH